MSWTDSSGDFWLFGGDDYDSSGWWSSPNDLWEFNPSTNEWAWMGGSSTVICIVDWANTPVCGQPAVYGRLGVPAAGNTPGGRGGEASAVDGSGNLWLFGGTAFDPTAQNGWRLTGSTGNLNDLWELNPSTNEWAWVSGCREGSPFGVYGTLGTPDAGNIPQSRYDAVSWTDSSGNFWLFGGSGGITPRVGGYLNDLWEFLPSTTSPPAATPTFSVLSGTYTSPQTVSISDTTPGAVIYYTLDGSSPTVCSAKYTAALAIDQTTTVTAVAVASGYANSAASATYTINLPTAVAPVFTPAAGVYASIQSVQIASTTPGAVIYYTLDGSTPTTGSARYTAAVTISQTTTVKAIATAYGYTNSSVASATYTINLSAAAAPVFTPAAGTYTSTPSVQIASTTPGAAIYYTLDGSTPNTGSAKYTAALTVSKPATVINAIAAAYGYANSSVARALYRIRPAAPAFSLASGQYLTPQSLTISDAAAGATIYYTTDGSAPSTTSTAYTGAIAIDKNVTVRAIAVVPRYIISPYTSAHYAIKTAAPAFSLAGGQYLTPQSLTISDAAAGAKIYYTTDGSAPTSSSTPYTGAIAIVKNVTIRAAAVVSGNVESPYTSAEYAIKTAAPVISPGTGIYATPQSVTISDSTAGATIYYTTDGSRPTTSSTPYTGAIAVTTNEKVRAIAVATGYAISPLAYANYGIK